MAEEANHKKGPSEKDQVKHKHGEAYAKGTVNIRV